MNNNKLERRGIRNENSCIIGNHTERMYLITLEDDDKALKTKDITGTIRCVPITVKLLISLI